MDMKRGRKEARRYQWGRGVAEGCGRLRWFLDLPRWLQALWFIYATSTTFILAKKEGSCAPAEVHQAGTLMLYLLDSPAPEK
ncbi:unnamed protein product [Amoebophrya sp. A120]|nr:unnamed protein product [Amoebophrya sp. A120]|eukprot:GSA120T00018741001.1